METLNSKQITDIRKNYKKLQSIRKTAKLLGIKENQIYKIIRMDAKTKELKLLETTESQISVNTTKLVDNRIPKLIDTITLKLLRELKSKYKELKPHQISQAVTALLTGKIKLEGLKLEDTKANIIKEVYGSMENMLSLYNEIQDTTHPDVINIKTSEVKDLKLTKLKELAKIT